MKLILTAAALALSLGASGCMGAMHDHHDAMMGGMMGEHRAQDCPNADPAQHDPAATDPAAHDHSAAAAEAQAQCPPADADHQHAEPQN